jgi:hypothetical protein
MSHDDLHNRSKLTKEALLAFVQLCDAVVDAVKEAGPQGAPAGPMYAAFMSVGMSLEQFERMMDVLVKAGRLRKQGHLYFYAEPQPETKQ